MRKRFRFDQLAAASLSLYTGRMFTPYPDAKNVNHIPRKITNWFAGYAFVFGAVNTLGCIFYHLTTPRSLELLGLFLGMLAAHTLLWSSTMDSSTLEQLALSVSNAGHARSITVSDLKSIVKVAILSAGISVLMAWALTEVYYNRDFYKWLFQMQCCALYFVFWPGLMAFCLWRYRHWLYAQAEEIRRSTDVLSVARQVLQKLGFLFLIGAAVLQIPAVLGG